MFIYFVVSKEKDCLIKKCYNMLLKEIDMSKSENYGLIDKVIATCSGHISDSGDYGYYYYRRKPYFFVRCKGSSYFCCRHWFTIEKKAFETYPRFYELMDWFCKFSVIRNLINKLK